ncbi:MAG: GGDEF domain-containing protein [Acidimicrobiaceae bacterium]|nr:GGDEF domain-containing protein [Acidimicrobiaceae bacterium]
MITAPLPDDEADRLAALADTGILDTLPEQAYDDITLLASQICETPIALMSLVDESRQWFKSKVGVEIESTPRDVSFCAHAILQPDQLFLVPDTHADERFADNPMVAQADVRFYAGVPLTTAGGHALGTLCVIHQEPHRLAPEQQQALWALSRQVIAQLELRRTIAALEAAAAERDRYYEELEASRAQLEQQLRIVAEQSVTDELTRLPNRRALIERLDGEVERARRHGTKFSVVMIDVDRFKQYNDTYGHVAGDEALQTIADILRSQTRASDVVGRWGGEEFVAVLTGTDAAGAERLGERYRSAVESGEWPLVSVTVSVGVASSSDDLVDVDQLMIAADQAMYRSKAEGGNRVSAR